MLLFSAIVFVICKEQMFCFEIWIIQKAPEIEALRFNS